MYACFCFCFLQEDMQEDFGWKLVHGDVFRPPTHPMLLSVFLGAGAQFMCMIIITLSEYIDCHSLILPLSLSLLLTIVFASLGFLSPPNRGAFMTAVLVSVNLIY